MIPSIVLALLCSTLDAGSAAPSSCNASPPAFLAHRDAAGVLEGVYLDDHQRPRPCVPLWVDGKIVGRTRRDGTFRLPLAADNWVIDASVETGPDRLIFEQRSSTSSGGQHREIGPLHVPFGVARYRLGPWGHSLVRETLEPASRFPRGKLRGALLAADGRPVPGAGVWALGWRVDAVTDDAGRFELELPSGPAELQVAVGDLHLGAREVVVPRGSTQMLQLILNPEAGNLGLQTGAVVEANAPAATGADVVLDLCSYHVGVRDSNGRLLDVFNALHAQAVRAGSRLRGDSPGLVGADLLPPERFSFGCDWVDTAPYRLPDRGQAIGRHVPNLTMRCSAQFDGKPLDGPAASFVAEVPRLEGTAWMVTPPAGMAVVIAIVRAQPPSPSPESEPRASPQLIQVFAVPAGFRDPQYVAAPRPAGCE